MDFNINPDNLIKKTKKPYKKHVSWNINSKVLKKFAAWCKDAGIKQNVLIENLVVNFLENAGKRPKSPKKQKAELISDIQNVLNLLNNK